MFKFCTIVLTSYANKVMQKILQNSLQQYVNWELLDVQTVFIKSRETREQIANIHWIIKKKKKMVGRGVDFQNTSSSASLTMIKSLTVWITENCGKFLRKWEYQATLPVSWETCMQVKKLDIEQWSVSKFGKE